MVENFVFCFDLNLNLKFAICCLSEVIISWKMLRADGIGCLKLDFWSIFHSACSERFKNQFLFDFKEFLVQLSLPRVHKGIY